MMSIEYQGTDYFLCPGDTLYLIDKGITLTAQPGSITITETVVPDEQVASYCMRCGGTHPAGECRRPPVLLED